MNDNWKDSPHWVLRFTSNGEWELAGPDGKIKSIDGGSERRFTLDLEMGNIPRFDMSGFLP